MKESKIKISIYCLYGCAAVQGATLLYGVGSAIKFLLPTGPGALEAGISPLSFASLYGGSVLYTVAFIAAILWIVKELKNNSAWGWFWGIVAFGFSLFSFALPASLLGLASLLDKRVRSEYIQKLDIQL